MQEKIAVVVVTYNRLQLLKECISGIRNQTVPLDEVIIVNNGSNDGTTEWLNEQGDITTYHQENIGGAGGFHRGVKEAYEKEYDWIWVMDDDVEPTTTCLEHLLEYKNISECIHPRRTYKDGTNYNWEQYYNIKKNSFIDSADASFKNGKRFCFVNVACFEGMLVSRNIVEKIGFPDARFFIGYDDTVYGLLASQYTNVLYTFAPIIIRKKARENDLPSGMFLYYAVRNQHLLKQYSKELNRFSSGFYFNPFIKALGISIKLIFRKEFTIPEKWQRLCKIWLGAIDGGRKKTGRKIFK